MYDLGNDNQEQYDESRELRHALQKKRLKKKHARNFYKDSYLNAGDYNPITNFANDRIENRRKYKRRRKRVKRAGKGLKKLLIYGGLGLTILILMLNMYACTIILTEPFTGRSAVTYMSKPDDIDEVELKFTELEADIQDQIDRATSDYPGYDEYRYSVGTIGHNPLTLASYLGAKYTEYNLREVSNEISQLSDEMYDLQFIPSVETYTVYELRTQDYSYDINETVVNEDGSTSTVTKTISGSYIYYEPVEYERHVLTVSLLVTPLESVVSNHMDSDTNDAFEMYTYSGGGLQVLGNPLQENWIGKVQSYYGYRSNTYGARELHRGIDITAYPGTQVYATSAGVVLTSFDTTYGYTLAIVSSDGATTQFGHLSWLAVASGSTVEKGDLIGTVGFTGHAGANHLHMEVKIDGEYVNPIFYVNCN